MKDLRIGVVGYGPGGRHFHTPFIEAAQGITLAGVVTKASSRRTEVSRDWPGVPIHESLADLLTAGVDAVTITTPPQTHAELALEAIAAGVHVIVDKPFAPTATVGRELTDAAQGGKTDAAFTIGLVHINGVTSYAEASKANYVAARELRAYGSKGCYRHLGTDVQAQAILTGNRPAANLQRWSYEDPSRWGTLATATGEEQMPAAQGRWHDFYTEFAAAARGKAVQPIPASEAIRTLQVLDAARESARHGETVQLADDHAGRAS